MQILEINLSIYDMVYGDLASMVNVHVIVKDTLLELCYVEVSGVMMGWWHLMTMRIVIVIVFISNYTYYNM